MYRRPGFPADQLHEIRDIHRIRLGSVHRQNYVFVAKSRTLRRCSLVNLCDCDLHGIFILRKPCPDSVILTRHADLRLRVLIRRVVNRISVIQSLQQSRIQTVLQILNIGIFIIIQINVS